jgi:hypothetical protein
LPSSINGHVTEEKLDETITSVIDAYGAAAASALGDR